MSAHACTEDALIEQPAIGFLVGFVNGLPLVLLELKASHKRLEDAYHKNLRDYKDTIPQLFWYNAFIILSNGSRGRIGSLTAEWEHFSEWKYLEEPNPGLRKTLTPTPSPTGRGGSEAEGADSGNPSDEAHQTQYDIFAMNMRNALPNAAFIGFTGTPLRGCRKTT